VNKVPCRRSKMTWTANIDVCGTTLIALYRYSPVSLTRDSWAAASLAPPELPTGARLQIPDNHHLNAPRPDEVLRAFSPVIRPIRRYNARVQRAGAAPAAHERWSQCWHDSDARALYRTRSRCNELLESRKVGSELLECLTLYSLGDVTITLALQVPKPSHIDRNNNGADPFCVQTQYLS
jgi:hypothetical protein